MISILALNSLINIFFIFPTLLSITRKNRINYSTEVLVITKYSEKSKTFSGGNKSKNNVLLNNYFLQCILYEIDAAEYFER